MSGGILRIICIMVFLAFGGLRDGRAEDEERTPMTRQEFAKNIFRGVPKTDVLSFCGEPDSEKPGAAGNVEMLYEDLIIEPSTDRRERVTVIIFVLYETVGAVRWADGTTSAAFVVDAIGKGQPPRGASPGCRQDASEVKAASRQ